MTFRLISSITGISNMSSPLIISYSSKVLRWTLNTSLESHTRELKWLGCEIVESWAQALCGAVGISTVKVIIFLLIEPPLDRIIQIRIKLTTPSFEVFANCSIRIIKTFKIILLFWPSKVAISAIYSPINVLDCVLKMEYGHGIGSHPHVVAPISLELVSCMVIVRCRCEIVIE